MNALRTTRTSVKIFLCALVALLAVVAVIGAHQVGRNNLADALRIESRAMHEVRLPALMTLALFAALYAGSAQLLLSSGRAGERPRPARKLIAILSIFATLVLVYAAFCLGSWAILLDQDGLHSQGLFPARAKKSLNDQITSAEILDIKVEPDIRSYVITLASRDDFAVGGTSKSREIERLERVLLAARPPVTLGVKPGSRAESALKDAIAATRAPDADLESYMKLFEYGRPCAGTVLAASRQAAESLDRTQAAQKPMLEIVAEHLLGIAGLFPNADERVALELALAERIGAEPELWDAVIAVRTRGDRAALARLLELLEDPNYRVKFLAAQNLLVLFHQGSLPPGTTPLIPGPQDTGGWLTLVRSWRQWVETKGNELVLDNGLMRLPSRAHGLKALAECAATRLNCLEELIDLIADTDANVRIVAHSHVRQLICAEDAPPIPAPAFPQDESWPIVATSWKEWFSAASATLIRRQCGEVEGWGFER